LRDTGAIDKDVLDERMQNAFTEPAPAAAPAAAQPAPPPMITCIRCQQQVVASATTMTADGAMCDPCAAR
jgi:hypothetical protein